MDTCEIMIISITVHVNNKLQTDTSIYKTNLKYNFIVSIDFEPNGIPIRAKSAQI